MWTNHSLPKMFQPLQQACILALCKQALLWQEDSTPKLAFKVPLLSTYMAYHLFRLTHHGLLSHLASRLLAIGIERFKTQKYLMIFFIFILWLFAPSAVAGLKGERLPWQAVMTVLRANFSVSGQVSRPGQVELRLSSCTWICRPHHLAL